MSEKTLTKISDDEKYGYIDESGCSWNSPEEWLWLEILGGCGCGSGDEIEKIVFNVLELFATEFNERAWSVYDDLKYEIIAHWMEHKGLLEHGSSVGASWLSEEGKRIYKIIKS